MNPSLEYIQKRLALAIAEIERVKMLIDAVVEQEKELHCKDNRCNEDHNWLK